MEKVNYVPRHIRLEQLGLFIPIELEPFGRPLHTELLDDGNIVVAEFEDYDPKDFELKTFIDAGVVPSEVEGRIVSSKFNKLDSISDFYDYLKTFNE